MASKDRFQDLLAIAEEFGWCVAIPDGEDYDMEDLVDIVVVGSEAAIEDLNPWDGLYIMFGKPEQEEVH